MYANAYVWNLERWLRLIYQQGSNGKTYREQTSGHRGGEEGEAEMYGQSDMGTHIATCNVDSQWEIAVWLRKLKQGLCVSLGGWGGEGDGGRFKREGYVYLRQMLVSV